MDLYRKLAAGAVGVLVLVPVLVLAAASPAGAHAELLETTPAAGAALDTAPERVELRFDEPVEAGVGAVRVFDADSERVDEGRVHHPGGTARVVAVDLPPVEDGTFVVTWRVISADAHPVQGAFTFQVGEATAGDTAALAERLLAAQGGDTTVGGAYAVVRALVFGSLLLLVGGVGFVTTLWPVGASDTLTRRLLVGAWIAAVATTIAAIGLQGAYGAGLGLDATVDPDVISSVLDTRFGRAALARLVLLGLAAPLLIAHRRRLVEGPRPGPAMLGSLAVAGIALLATPALSGHASSGRLIAAALATDVVHLAAVSAWLGGLVLLVAGPLRRGDPDRLAHVVPRFSRLAFAAVAVILASGAFQSWRQLDTFDALTDTTYGRLLSAKLGLVAGMIGLGALGRSWVRRRYGHPAAKRSNEEAPAVAGAAAADADERGALAMGGASTPVPGEASGGDVHDTASDRASTVGQLRRSVAAEVAIAVAVLAVTSLLVNAIPGEQALALPYSTELELGDDMLADVVVDPAKAGPLDVHLYTLTTAGQPSPVEEVTIDLRLPERDIGPLSVPLQRAGPNHFVAYDFDIPIPGEWELDVAARVSEFDQVSAQAVVSIR